MARVHLGNIKGPQGETGPQGKSAYEYAVDGGYTGTEAEFAEDMNPNSAILKSDIAQTTGVDEATVMSQKATTDNINSVLDLHAYGNFTLNLTAQSGYRDDNFELIAHDDIKSFDITKNDARILLLSVSNEHARSDVRIFVDGVLVDSFSLTAEEKTVYLSDNMVINVPFKSAHESYLVVRKLELSDVNYINDMVENLMCDNDDTSALTKIVGYRDDDYTVNDNDGINSYDITTKEAKIVKLTFDSEASKMSEVRLFDSNHVLLEKTLLSAEPITFVLKEGYTLNVPFFVVDAEYLHITLLTVGNYAGRPANGYENFSVEVNYSDFTANSNDENQIYTDYGVIALPDTYEQSGKQTKLIIFCQGTGERTGESTNPLSNYGWEYFLSKGYAVMDMNGMAPDWGTAKGFPVTNQHYCNKHLLTSYAKGYEYVTSKYNLDKRVFVAGISMGGGASALIVQSKILPVIAHVAFCPALSVYKQDYMNPWGGADQQKTIAGQWGFADWETTAPSKEYFLANIDKVKGFDNLLINTIGAHADANAEYDTDAEATAYNSMAKVYPVPLKIWHCLNDSVVLSRYSEFMVNMIKNAGGQAWLRTFETGGHAGGWNYGEYTEDGVTASIPFREAVLFFERYV